MPKENKVKKWYNKPLLVIIVAVVIIIAFFIILEAYLQYNAYQQQQALNRQMSVSAQQSIQNCEVSGLSLAYCRQICAMAYGNQYC